MTGNSRFVALSATLPTNPAHPGDINFESVYEEHFSFVWAMARRMGVAESALDDVCQEVFVIVHKRLSEFEGRSSLKTWVFGILHNVVLVHRRALSRKSPYHRTQAPLVDPETLADHGHSPHEQLSNAEEAKIAQDILNQLDEDKRTLLVLAELEEMSVPDIAEATATNVNTVYARLRAARKEFAAAVNRYRAKERWRMT